MAEGHFGPLPLADGEFPIKRGKFIDIETFGLKATDLSAITGTLTNLTVKGTITLGSGGSFLTATSGARISLASANQASMFLFSGAAGESLRATIYTAVTGTGVTERANLLINSAAMDGTTWGDVLIALRSASEDDSTSPPEITFTAPGDSSQIPLFRFADDMRIRAEEGTAALPAYSFDDDPDTGMYLDTTNSIGWTTAGTERMQLGTAGLNFGGAVNSAATIKADGAGTESLPAYSFANDLDTGIYQSSAGRVQMSVNGSTEFVLTATEFRVLNVYNVDDGGGNNVKVDSDGQLHRDSSALKVKDNVQKIDDLDSLADVKLEPATWTKHGRPDMGLIADWLDVQHPLLGIHVDGEIDDYRDRAVMAVMAAKINRLEKRLEELEK